ncbi:hypothetical protein MUN84_16225 [Hymenobacter sp. 5516J-16]|nr:hypothetical protein [Hymenobacter sp. 5516J-16]UOQ76132.1 hypothetical protein MUN84_16225 [Hymenobacter sp. 5516J-16]
MAATTFRESSATAYYNATFVSYQVDITADTAFARRHDIVSFPTYLYFDATGKPLHRSLGAKPAAEFIADGQAAFHPKQAFYALQRRYNAGNRSVRTLYAYSTALTSSSQKQNLQAQVIDEYLATQSAKQLRSERNLRYIYTHASPRTDLFLIQHQDLFQPWYKSLEIQKKAERTLTNMAFTAGRANDTATLRRVRQLVLASFPDTVRANSLATINFLEGQRNWVSYARATLRFAQSPHADLYTLRKTATYVKYFGKEQGPAREQESLQLVAELLPLLLQRQKDYQNTLLYAQVLHLLHQETQALSVAQEALRLAQAEQESAEEASTLLVEIQAAQK